MLQEKGTLLDSLKRMKELGMSRLGLLLLVGVALFIASSLLSGQTKEEAKELPAETWQEAGIDGQQTDTFAYISRQEERLKKILQSMEGIGTVEVMISVASSGERVTLSDNPYVQKVTEETDSAGGTRKITEVEREDATIYESDGSSQVPYVIKELEPELSGVLVVAQGAGSDAIKAEIVEAVEALFGLPAHRIKVIKRRG